VQPRKVRRPGTAETVREPHASAKAVELKRREASPQPSQLQTVYDGRTCIGHIVTRVRTGFEAFDRADRSLGIFTSARSSLPLDLITGQEKRG